MIYLRTLNTDTNRDKEQLFFSWGDVHAALFSPDVEQLAIIEFKTHGKTYAERRENLRQMAIDYKTKRKSAYSDLTLWEYVKISDFFKKNGARLGLMREFHENGIC